MATYLYTLAFKHASISTLMPFEHTNLVFAIIIGYIIFAETIAPTTVLGATLIVALNLKYYYAQINVQPKSKENTLVDH